MTFFESLLLIMLVAIALLQVARRLSLPYPTLLAGAGVVVALIPGTPVFDIEPQTYLALFIAPVLVDAAFDFPLGATQRFLTPLFVLAVGGVVLIAGVVAWLAHVYLGLPIAAGLALGAIVAPPDAAAATAVLRGISIPRSTYAVLQGESLFNDSTALLLFSTALALLPHQGVTAHVALLLGAAIPGGVLFGVACAYAATRVMRFVQGTLGGNLLQFVLAYAIWIMATHLHLSAVLATVAFAMTIANITDATEPTARMRVQSYAVWSAVVFALNVFAFMLMGMQARNILGRMQRPQLHHALGFAALIVCAVILVRLVMVLVLNLLQTVWEKAHGRPERASLSQAMFTGWCGMRGFVTMATALSLPQAFPMRDTAVLTAFSVVLSTLVLQGATLTALVRLLHLDRSQEAEREMNHARIVVSQSALASLAGEQGPEPDNLRFRFSLVEKTCAGEVNSASLHRMRELGLRAVKAERNALENLRTKDAISINDYLGLQEQIDWVELTFIAEEDRKIEEI